MDEIANANVRRSVDDGSASKEDLQQAWVMTPSKKSGRSESESGDSGRSSQISDEWRPQPPSAD